MRHSSTSTYTPNFIEIKETFCGRTYGRADVHLRPTLLGRLGGVDLKISFAGSFNARLDSFEISLAHLLQSQTGFNKTG